MNGLPITNTQEKVEVTRVDTVNNIISGTFEFNAVNRIIRHNLFYY